MTSTETCSACACAIPDSTMHFVYQNEDDDDLRLCGACEEKNLKKKSWLKKWRMIEVWKLGTSVDVSDETEFGELYIPDLDDSAFACEDEEDEEDEECQCDECLANEEEVFTHSPICIEIDEEKEEECETFNDDVIFCGVGFTLDEFAKVFKVFNKIGDADKIGLDVSDFMIEHFEIETLGNECLSEEQMELWRLLKKMKNANSSFEVPQTNERLNKILDQLAEQFDGETGEFIYKEDEEDI